MSAAIVILQILAQYGPAVAEAAQRIATSKDPTQADWDALFVKARKGYDDYIREAEERAKP